MIVGERFHLHPLQTQGKGIGEAPERFRGPSSHVVRWHIEQIRAEMADKAVRIGYAKDKFSPDAQ